MSQFAGMGTLFFGESMKGYSSFGSSTATCFMILLGSVDYDAMQACVLTMNGGWMGGSMDTELTPVNDECVITSESVSGQMDGWMDAWMGRWMDG